MSVKRTGCRCYCYPAVAPLYLISVFLALHCFQIFAHATHRAFLPTITISDVRTCPCTFQITNPLNSALLDFIVRTVRVAPSKYTTQNWTRTDRISLSFSRYAQTARDAYHKDGLLAYHRLHVPLRAKVQLSVYRASEPSAREDGFVHILPDSRRANVCPVLIPQHPAPETVSSIFMHRIIGGQPANPMLTNYLAFIFIRRKLGAGYSACSGSVIGANVVLTAAHCRVTNQSLVYIGFEYFNVDYRPKNSYAVKQFVAHPMHSVAATTEEAIQYDIAYILLRENVSESTPILRVNQDRNIPSPDSFVRSIGYGVVTKDSHAIEDDFTLNQVDLVTQSQSECEAMLINTSINVAPGRVLCAGRADRDGCGIWYVKIFYRVNIVQPEVYFDVYRMIFLYL